MVRVARCMVGAQVYHMENLCELNHYQVYREIRVHSALSHQHIIQLYCAFQVRARNGGARRFCHLWRTLGAAWDAEGKRG